MDASVGHLDRPPTVFPTVTAQVESHSDWARGVEARGIVVLADVDLPTVAGYYHFPTGAGYLANVPFRMQTRTPPGLGNAPYALVSTHGSMHYLPTNYSELASPDGATPFDSDYRMLHSLRFAPRSHQPRDHGRVDSKPHLPHQRSFDS